MENNDISNKKSLLKNKRNISIFLVLIIGPLIFFIISYFMRNEMNETLKEFPIVNISDSLNGKIEKIEQIKRGDAVKIVLTNHEKGILLHSINDQHLPKNRLSYFLEIKDSIYKSANIDSLFIYRGSNVYYFIIRKRIDKLGNQY